MNPITYNPLTSINPPTNLPVQEITKCKTIDNLKQIHAKLIKTGQILDPLLSAELLRFSSFSSHRDLKYARLLFYNMNHPNCFSYNTIIRALSESSNDVDGLLEALTIYILMLHDEFVSPNRFTFPSVLKACAQSGNLDVGKQVHGQVVKLGLEKDEYVTSNLLKMYVMCGAMKDAFFLFDRRVKGNDDDDVQGNGLTAINGFCKRRQEGNVVLWNVMVDGYVGLGDLRAARKLFDEMPERSVVSWNGMIAGYAQQGKFKDAVQVFREMQRMDLNVRPNYITLLSVLPAISHLGALDLGKWVHLYAEKNGIEIDDVLGSALIDMYSKCGSIEKALQVFERLPKNSTVTWNAIIGGLAMHGCAKMAIDYFLRMEEMGVEPSDVTYISILTACSHASMVCEGKLFFDRMVRVVGLEPRIEHYGCMVDLLGRNGLLKEAEELIFSMPMKPDDVIFKALLGACKMHGDIEMGKRVAKHLMEMAPCDSGSYVALSNMYALLGNWEEVAQLRLLMKNMDIRKDPGCSWIEIEGVIHEFLVEDSSHPHAKEISSMLQEISNRLSSVGYQPDTTQVLLKIDEEEKQSVLYYHSEKIAIAFGLISTNPGTPLQVVKNLRICDDCHSSIKLISKLYKRQIVVRDRKRFHHFKEGACSCMDYW
ncbi:Pentatricopeptide repeat-containing protein At5g48910 [Ancistrocladus abbreviatus]